VSAVVGNARDVLESRGVKQRTYAQRLIEAVLEQERTSVGEMFRRIRDDAAYRIEAIRAGRERRCRLETQIALREVCVAGGDVRRIRDDEVEARIAECGMPVADCERDVADAEPRSIATRAVS